MENIKKSDSNLLANIAKGTLISLISTVIMLLIFSLILSFTNVQENTSILIGSSIANIKIRKNGLINGALIGACYILTIYLISSILNWKFSLNLQSIIMIVIAIIFGILGGIIGVNRK